MLLTPFSRIAPCCVLFTVRFLPETVPARQGPSMPVLLVRTQGIYSTLQAPHRRLRMNDKPIAKLTCLSAWRDIVLEIMRPACIPQMAKTKLASLSLFLSLLLCRKKNTRKQFDFYEFTLFSYFEKNLKKKGGQP